MWAALNCYTSELLLYDWNILKDSSWQGFIYQDVSAIITITCGLCVHVCYRLWVFWGIERSLWHLAFAIISIWWDCWDIRQPPTMYLWIYTPSSGHSYIKPASVSHFIIQTCNLSFSTRASNKPGSQSWKMRTFFSVSIWTRMAISAFNLSGNAASTRSSSSAPLWAHV